MGKKEKRRSGRLHHRQQPYTQPKDRGTSGWLKWLVIISLLVIIGVIAVWQFSSPKERPSQLPPAESQYPKQANGIFYNNPTTTDNGTKVKLPLNFVKDKKIVFLDMPLTPAIDRIDYQDRAILLSQYKSGNYLPLIVLYTPSGNIKTGIRTCEPCAGFSMHIETSQNRVVLVCDICNTLWDIETFNGISGGCPENPPPELPFSMGDNIEIDLSSLGITLA